MPGGESARQQPVDELAGRLLDGARRFPDTRPRPSASPVLASLEAQVRRHTELLDRYQAAVEDYRTENAERRGAWRWLERVGYAGGGFLLAKIAEILT